jgi:hypothetical protein
MQKFNILFLIILLSIALSTCSSNYNRLRIESTKNNLKKDSNNANIQEFVYKSTGQYSLNFDNDNKNDKSNTDNSKKELKSEEETKIENTPDEKKVIGRYSGSMSVSNGVIIDGKFHGKTKEKKFEGDITE